VYIEVAPNVRIERGKTAGYEPANSAVCARLFLMNSRLSENRSHSRNKMEARSLGSMSNQTVIVYGAE